MGTSRSVASRPTSAPIRPTTDSTARRSRPVALVTCPAATASHVSDTLGRRWKTTASAATTLFAGYDGGTQALARQEPGTTISAYILGPDQMPVAIQDDRTGAVTQHLADNGQGSIATVTTGAKVGVCGNRLNPFGATEGVGCAALTKNQRWYQGTRRDSPQVATASVAALTSPAKPPSAPRTRWAERAAPRTSPSESTPLTNRYTYVNGDPVNYSDPSGHGPCPETGQRPNGIEQQGGSPTTCVIETPTRRVGTRSPTSRTLQGPHRRLPTDSHPRGVWRLLVEEDLWRPRRAHPVPRILAAIPRKHARRHGSPNI